MKALQMKPANKRVMKMSFLEKISLSPFQKYYKFNRFPWKFVVHILSVFFTTYQVFAMIQTFISHSRAQHQVFKYILFDSSDQSNSIPFFKLDDFQNNVLSVCDNLANINDSLLQYADNKDTQYSLEIYYSQFDLVNSQQAKIDIPDISECIKSPFDITDPTSVKTFLNQIAKMSIMAEGIKVYSQYTDSPDQNSCLTWDITLEYDFQSYANIEATISTSSTLCEGDTTQSTFGYNFVFIHIVVMVLAVISLVLSIKYIYEVGKKYIKHKVTYQNVQKQFNGDSNNIPQIELTTFGSIHEKKELDIIESQVQDLMKDNKSWEEIGLLNKIKMFNLWLFVTIIGNIIQIFGSLVALLDIYMVIDLPIFTYKESIIGFGSMFAWIIMLNYLQYNKNINLMTSTLQKSSSNIFMFLLGVLPFFFGFVFLGQCIFWKYSKFEDTSTSIITLFSLSNGDIVNEVFMDTWAEGILGQIYLIVFMIMFYTAVQNVFITIIMEGYDDSKRDKNKSDFEEENETVIKSNDEIDEEESKFLQDGSSKSDKEMVLNKLRINTKRIKKILDDIEVQYEKIGGTRLKKEDKDYLIRVYYDNLDNLNRNLKFQLTTMGR